jgi:hypothetical protein
VHEASAHERNEFEEAAGFFGDLLQGAQKKKGDQGDGEAPSPVRPTGRCAALAHRHPQDDRRGA